MKRTLRSSIGMIALLLATIACVNEADAQSTYTPQYQAYNPGVATVQQPYQSNNYSTQTYTPPASNFYRGQVQPQNSRWTQPLNQATNYTTPQQTAFRAPPYTQKTTYNPSIYQSNTPQAVGCQGGT